MLPALCSLRLLIMNETAHIEHRDYVGAKLGMWLFLFTEILLFGGMFLLYSIYRDVNTADFHEAAKEMSVLIGAINTIILLTSSLTIVLALSALRNGKKTQAILFQILTVILGFVFLGNKYMEWSDHIHHGFYPNSPELLAMSHGKILFFGLYYVMTGIHALHVLIGASVIGGVAVMTARGSVTSRDYVKLENSALFWHLVDVIWIYLFPLFYLIT